MSAAIESMVGEAADAEVASDGGADASGNGMESAPENAGGSEAGGDETPASEEIAPQAPAADAWRPPSREEYEELRRHAEIGREFAPHAEQIRGTLRRAFEPNGPGHAPSQPQSQAPAPAAATPDDYDTYFGNPKAFDAWKASARDDPSAYAKAMSAVARRALRDELAQIKALKDEIAGLTPRVNDVYGFALTAGKRFQETPKWAQYGKSALELVQKGEVMNLDLAFEIAEKRALAAGATPKQAAQAGAAAQQVQARTNAAAGKAPAPARPAPRDEPSLRPAPAGRGTAAKPQPRPTFDRKRAGKYEQDLVKAALAKHGVR